MTADGSAKLWNWASIKRPLATGSFRPQCRHPDRKKLIPTTCGAARHRHAKPCFLMNKTGSSPRNTCANSYYFHSNQISRTGMPIRRRAEATASHRTPATQTASSQRRIQHHHHDKAEHQSAGGKCLMALAVRFGNDFVADDEQHGAGGDGQAQRQQAGRPSTPETARPRRGSRAA